MIPILIKRRRITGQELSRAFTWGLANREMLTTPIHTRIACLQRLGAG